MAHEGKRVLLLGILDPQGMLFLLAAQQLEIV